MIRRGPPIIFVHHCSIKAALGIAWEERRRAFTTRWAYSGSPSCFIAEINIAASPAMAGVAELVLLKAIYPTSGAEWVRAARGEIKVGSGP